LLVSGQLTIELTNTNSITTSGNIQIDLFSKLSSLTVTIQPEF
jgi:hypothetical protein